MQKRLSLAQLGPGFLNRVDSEPADSDLRLIALGASHEHTCPLASESSVMVLTRLPLM
jgi:hypothetical protein